jgi:hypothetical protein
MTVLFPTPVSAPLGLERDLDVPQLRGEASEHRLDDMVRPEAKNTGVDLRR